MPDWFSSAGSCHSDRSHSAMSVALCSRWLKPAIALVGRVLVALSASRSGSIVAQSGTWNAPSGSDFLLPGGSYTNQLYSSLDQINTSNIRKLGGAWSIHLEEQRPLVGNLQGTPIVVNGVM